jgi:hypothetical protein
VNVGKARQRQERKPFDLLAKHPAGKKPIPDSLLDQDDLEVPGCKKRIKVEASA